MEIDKIRSERISHHASAKIIKDCYPDVSTEEFFSGTDIDSREMAMHAGALCLYATTLLTKVHETNPQWMEFDAKEREDGLIKAIKNSAKYSHLTDEKISTMAHNCILRDIRNCFEHGNFEISYDVYSKRLNYILRPQRKDFVIGKPIIISKEGMFKANRAYIASKGRKYQFLTPEQIVYKAKFEPGIPLKELLLPGDMLRLAENYIDKKLNYRDRYKPTVEKYMPLYYPLLVSQMTYEQDEYYNLFNKDSNIFKKIAHIRNSVAHNTYQFNKKLDIDYKDRDKNMNNTLEKSVGLMMFARDQKNMILYLQQRIYPREFDPQNIDTIKKFFDEIFIYGGYEEELNEELVMEEDLVL